MISILGFAIDLPPGLKFLDTPLGSFLVTALAWVLIALLANFFFAYIVKRLTRRLPSEIEDIIFGIVSRPLIYLIIAYGLYNSLEILPLSAPVALFVSRLFNTFLILTIVYLLWRVIKDVIVYYGHYWARKTESPLDDILVPVLNLFGPLVILIIAGFIVFPIWGINLASVLVGAGVVGLVLGLALQDTLSNVFSGLSLLVETPFRTGDVVVLNDGRPCEVEKVGLRSTQFYSLDDHSTVYLPNKTLTAAMILNITKPTLEQKASIELKVGINSNLAHTQELLRRIACSHPNVLVDDVCDKVALLSERIAKTREQVEQAGSDMIASQALLEDAQKYQHSIEKLELEDVVNQRLIAFQRILGELRLALTEHEKGGLSSLEKEDIFARFVFPADDIAKALIAAAAAWAQVPDLWSSQEECQNDLHLWLDRNERLSAKWKGLRNTLQKPRQDNELRLDDSAQAMIDWINKEYKTLPGLWKNPQVTFKEFDGTSAILTLWFYIDNIRLEHYNRKRRVTTEIARLIREQFSEEGIWVS